MNLRSTLRTARLLLAGVALLAVTAACDSLASSFGAYTGPPPATEPLSSELATVTWRYTSPDGTVSLYLDRARYVQAGDPHNVNRVIEARTTAENKDEVATLSLQVGDRVRISTEFSHVAEAGGDLNVRNWPGHDAMEYPIGSHRITAIERAGLE